MELKNLQNGSDIRGVALEGIKDQPVTLTSEAVYLLARGFYAFLKEKTKKDSLRIAVGHDSRLSADSLKQAIFDGLLFDGANVLDCGLASTPSLFMACIFEDFDCDGSIMITASHLPFNRNGMKFFTKDGGLDKQDIARIIELAEKENFVHDSNGTLTKADLIARYSHHLQEIIKTRVNANDYQHPLKGLRIVVDAGNGAGGFYAEKVLAPLGADVSGSQFLEPDGHFPNHIPNPEDKEAMDSICNAVIEHSADLGIIFDTDVDRSSAVDENGQPISRNAIIALASLLSSKPNRDATIVTDSVTSDELTEFLSRHGYVHHRFKRGYKNVINEAIRLNNEGINCPLAIETSGHAALRENYFLDDGAYLATLIVIQAAKSSISSLLSDLKHPAYSTEIRIKINADDFKTVGQKALDAFRTYCESNENFSLAKPNYEGVRVNGFGGWILLRMSLHDPILPCNIEGHDKACIDAWTDCLKEALSDFSELDF